MDSERVAPRDPDEPGVTRSTPDAGRPSLAFGPYRLLQPLGEGGMGHVWLAEQVQPIHRQVAIKVVKAGMDTAHVVARFEAERQALALMDHPAIARVFDAGSTPEGRPYFAMEYVKGEPITTYCDRHRLTTRERLALFIQVCDGVQHAHQKAIIHRDLKPSNVLVTLQDDRPVPKIIDFGVAKAMTQHLTDRTLHTELGVLVGTPEYMSPEQAEMGGLDVDTRTDVYALGVILYELLTGSLPFDARALRQKGLDEIRRTIREVEPARPSTRITKNGSTSEHVAQNRRTEPARLVGQLRGDLDWITMRALEKDRTRRYATANDLSTDIGRTFRSEPVSAGPPGATYRVGKFVKRHQYGVTAAAALVVVLVVFAAVMAVQAQRIARERDRANREAERATIEAAAAKQVSDFLAGLFKVSDPSDARGSSVTAREILDKGARDIDQTLRDQPDVQARLQATMGEVYTNLGVYGAAQTLLEQAVATRERRLGDDNLETLTAMNQLANVYWFLGQFDKAEPLYHRVVDGRRRVLGDEHPDTLRAKFDLGSLYVLQKRWDDADYLVRSTLDVQTRVLGDGHPDTLASLGSLQSLYYAQGRYAEAEPVALRALQADTRALGPDHPGVLTDMHNLATIYDKLGKQGPAEALYLETIAGERRVLGEHHPRTAVTQYALAAMYATQGRHAEAEPLALSAYEARARAMGADHDRTQAVVEQLVQLYEAWGRPTKADEWRAKLIRNPAPSR
ncbi:MAG: tetratricopeptide repeat protein [Acidobacteriota bacterium]